MSLKKIIKIFLFIFIALSFAVLIYKEFTPKTIENTTAIAEVNNRVSNTLEKVQTSSKTEPEKKEVPSSSANISKSEKLHVIAYYFHGTYRCITCRTIEKYSKEAIEYFFSEELKKGKLEFKSINVEDPESRHFIQDYQLFTRSLVLSLVNKDKEVKWKVLPDVWKYYRDKNKFFKYVKDEVENFLKET